jgi:hypothetical protein
MQGCVHGTPNGRSAAPHCYLTAEARIGCGGGEEVRLPLCSTLGPLLLHVLGIARLPISASRSGRRAAVAAAACGLPLHAGVHHQLWQYRNATPADQAHISGYPATSGDSKRSITRACACTWAPYHIHPTCWTSRAGWHHPRAPVRCPRPPCRGVLQGQRGHHTMRVNACLADMWGAFWKCALKAACQQQLGR